MLEPPVENASPARRSVLAVLMLVILAVSVVSAEMLVARARKRIDAGTKIVETIHSLGLKHFLPAGPEIDWYIIKSRKGPVGWLARYFRRSRDDNYVGVVICDIPGGHKSSQRWSLNADATRGQYISQVIWASGRTLKVSITFSNGEVTVVRRKRGFLKPEIAKAPSPGNYLPEGTFNLALGLVAKMRADAQFAMVFDEQPNFGAVVQFGTARIRYIDQKATQHGKVIRVEVISNRFNEKISQVYYLDETERVLQILLPDNKRVVACDEETVLKSFPGALEYLQRFLPQPLGPVDEEIDNDPMIRLLRHLLSD